MDISYICNDPYPGNDSKDQLFLDRVSKEYISSDGHMSKYYYPQTTEEIPYLIQSPFLKETISEELSKADPNIKDLKIQLSYYRGYCIFSMSIQPMHIYVNVQWKDGLIENTIKQITRGAIELHNTQHDLDKQYYEFSITTERTYSDTVLLSAAQKYADLLVPGIVVNVNNIDLLKLASATLRELAVADLSLENILSLENP